MTTTTANNQQINTGVTFYVSSFFNPRCKGILEIESRWENGSTSPTWLTARWLVCDNRTDLSRFIVTWSCDSNKKVLLKLYINTIAWTSYSIKKILENSWGTHENNWVTMNCLHAGLTSIPSNETQIISTMDVISNSTNHAIYSAQIASSQPTGPTTWYNTGSRV